MNKYFIDECMSSRGVIERYFVDGCFVIASEEFHRGAPIDRIDYENLLSSNYPVRDLMQFSKSSNDAWFREVKCDADCFYSTC